MSDCQGCTFDKRCSNQLSLPLGGKVSPALIAACCHGLTHSKHLRCFPQPWNFYLSHSAVFPFQQDDLEFLSAVCFWYAWIHTE
jgi:hypothetical protein